LFALDAPVLDEGASTAPASSVFFDSVPTAGRASRFRQLFAQEPPAQPAPLDSRPSVDRSASNPVFTSAPKPTASAEDREGFQRIMAMLGGGGGSGKPAMPVVPHLNHAHFSSWTNHLQCNHQHSCLCRMVQLKASQKRTSFSVYFDRDNLAVQTLYHIQALQCQ